MPLEIVHYPHPTLRHVSKPIKRVDQELRDWVAQMFDLMYEFEGVGLAANQVDLPYRMFVANPTGDSQQPDSEHVFINPVLSKAKGIQTGSEGCLSLPEVRADVSRSNQVHVEAYDLAGNLLAFDLEGFPARVVQHEIDHLEGTLFIDRLSDTAMADVRHLIEEFEIEYDSRQEMGEAKSEADVLARLAELEAART
ncbi:MAG: peptide deformylase [Aeoliella sp.]